MKKLTSLLIIALAITTASACKKAAQKDAALSEKTAPNLSEQVLHYNIYVEPEYLDPTFTAEESGTAIVTNIFLGLTEYDPKTSEPRPAIATSWDVSPDGKRYTFHLRDDAKWNDASPVTAKDFVYSWQRAIDPATAAKSAYMLYYIKNGRAINTGTEKDISKFGVKALDDYTLKVELENPAPFFVGITAYNILKPLKKEVIEKYGQKWTRPENIVSNGYFNLTKWTPSKEIVVEKNPFYWDMANVNLDKVIFTMVEEQETALKAFQNGELDFINQIPPIKVPSLRDKKEFAEAAQLANFFLIINTTTKPFDNKLLRQALAHSINRSQIVKVINSGIPSSSCTPDNTAGYHPPKGLEFNPEAARRLLKEAGYSDIKKLPTITLLYNTNERNKMIMEIVQNMWKENLGMDVQLLNMEWKVSLKTIKELDYQIARRAWSGDYLDPNTFLDMFISDSGMSNTGWKSPEYDALIAEATKITDKQKRFEYYAKAEKILLEEAPIIPIFTNSKPMMISKNVTGIYPTLLNMHPLKGVKKVVD